MDTGISAHANRGSRRGENPAVRRAADDGEGVDDKAYRGFFEHAWEGFFQTTPEGRFLRANPALARIYGYESPKALINDLTNLNNQLYVEPGRRAEFLRLMKDPGEVIEFESEVYRRDGSIIWISENARVVSDEGGNPLLYEGSVQDITARKRAEFDLRTSQRFIERVTHASPNILYVFDLIEDRYIYANERIFRILGRTPGEVIGMGQEFLDAFSHPDDAWLLKERALELSQAIDGEVFEYEMRLLHSDGGWRWINARETVFTRSSAGRPQEVIGTAQDITERKQTVDALLESEERFRNLVEGADAIFWERKLGCRRFNYIGPQAEKLLGYPVENWYLPGFWLDHVYEEDQHRVERFWRGERTGAGERQTIEYRMRDARGRPVWVKEIGHVSKDEAGGVIMQGFMMDVTKLQLAQMEARRSQEQLRALSARLQTAIEEERTNIAREIHDELGGALTALKMDISKVIGVCGHGHESLGGNEYINEKLFGALTLIDRTVDSVRKIATELRPPILDSFGIVAAIEWQVEEFQKRFGIRCDLQDQWSAKMPEDQALATVLFRVFQEMLTNVARHSQATAVVVRLYQDTEDLVLCVSDNGRGITEGERRNSLGLLGMQERAGMVGGEVEIRGVEGKGTDAKLKIPLSRVLKPNAAPKKERLYSPERP